MLAKPKDTFCIYNPGGRSLVVRQWQNYKREQHSNFRRLWCFVWFRTYFWIFSTISYWQARGVCSTLVIFMVYSYSHGLCNYFPWCTFLWCFKEGTILVNNSLIHFKTFSFSNERCILPMWLYYWIWIIERIFTWLLLLIYYCNVETLPCYKYNGN